MIRDKTIQTTQSPAGPQVRMLDEPSLGLAPLLQDEVLDTVRKLKERGISIASIEPEPC